MRRRTRQRANDEGYIVVHVDAITDPIRCAHDCVGCDYTDRLFEVGGKRLRAIATEVAIVHVSACRSGLALAAECRNAS